MRERLSWVLPILDSIICAVIGARYAAGSQELQLDLEEAYDALMRARRAIRGALRFEEQQRRAQRHQN